MGLFELVMLPVVAIGAYVRFWHADLWKREAEHIADGLLFFAFTTKAIGLVRSWSLVGEDVFSTISHALFTAGLVLALLDWCAGKIQKRLKRYEHDSSRDDADTEG